MLRDFFAMKFLHAPFVCTHQRLVSLVCVTVVCYHGQYFTFFLAKITRCGHVFCWACLLHYLCLVSLVDYKKQQLKFRYLYIYRVTESGANVLSVMSQFIGKISKGINIFFTEIYTASICCFVQCCCSVQSSVQSW